MSEVIQRNKQEVEEIAKALGLIAVLPEPDEVLIDLDTPLESSERRVIEVLADNGYIQLAELRTTSQNGRTHLYYQINRNLTSVERIALQALLNSDPVREVLSLIRSWLGSECPTALFETPAEYLKVRRWRKSSKRLYSASKA